jgi:predicted lactoylglutathione lyase
MKSIPFVHFDIIHTGTVTQTQLTWQYLARVSLLDNYSEQPRETISSCESSGDKVTVPALEIQAGMPIGMVEDPDGNWVEFLQMDQ